MNRKFAAICQKPKSDHISLISHDIGFVVRIKANRFAAILQSNCKANFKPLKGGAA